MLDVPRPGPGGLRLRQEALAELAEAAAIYEQYENYHGLGSVNLNYAYLHLDNGDLEHAEAAAKKAFPGWRDTPAPRRAEILYAAGEILKRF